MRNTTHKSLAGIASLVVLVAMSSATPTLSNPDAPRSTRIVEPLVVGGQSCTIQILAEAVVCEGEETPFVAELVCADGLLLVNDPEWLLDGEPVGSGDQIQLELTAGEHLVEVSCGSCQDQILVEAVDCSMQPKLDAVYSDDQTEADPGIFLAANIAPVNGLTFGHLRYAMRPFTLAADSSVADGTYTLTVEGDPILELYEESGASISLPAAYDRSELPVTFLVNATTLGEADLVATRSENATTGSPTEDRVRVRVGPWPGLSGRELSAHPHFLFANTFNDDDVMTAAIDPSRHAERIGLTYDAYVVAQRPASAWALGGTLVDVTGGAEAMTVQAGSIGDNITELWSSGLDAGDRLSRDYAIVFDFGQDGRFDPGDLIDGFSYSEAGTHVVADLSQPGPYDVSVETYSGGGFLTQVLYYPSSIEQLGAVPLVVVSHGNGHAYTWYEYLGNHFASHGYVLMSHRNNTVPGIETASTTTLTNTDYLLGNLDTIAGGVLDGHIDESALTWIGHSRGGEGVVRAYDRVLEDPGLVTHFSAEDIALVGSIAPTAFLPSDESDPHEVDYFLIGAAADGDVSGRPNCTQCQYFRLSDRAQGKVQTLYVHGAAHNDFNCCGNDDGTGPNQIGRAESQVIAKSYLLALVEYYIQGNEATKEYFTRMYDDLSPSGIDASVEISTSYRELGTPSNLVIDDFQSAGSTGQSSSGGTVTLDVSNVFEGFNEDNDTSFTPTTTDPMNGMIYHSGQGDFTKGLIFDHSTDSARFLEFEVVPEFRDFRFHQYLSFRACQGTRHEETRALNGPHSFGVTLRDASGQTSTVRFGAWGELTQLYPRTGYGSFTGWVNEMNTVRIPLATFEMDGTGIDLSDIVAIRFEFGSDFGAERGRIGIDDIQVMKE